MLAVPATARQSPDPTLLDPLAGDEPPFARPQLRGTVRRLEPRVRTLKPVVRHLQTEKHHGRQTTVTVSADVLFAFDSARLAPAARRIVTRLAHRIDAAASGAVRVVGHTDSIGSRQYNQRLSESRAASVAAALRRTLAEPRKIRTEGRNFSEPIAPNEINGEDNPAGRARNRRVEISFVEPARERRAAAVRVDGGTPQLVAPSAGLPANESLFWRPAAARVHVGSTRRHAAMRDVAESRRRLLGG